MSDPSSAPPSELATVAARRRGQRGFTLLEIMVVLAILAMVAGLSIGVYRQVEAQNVLPVAASQVSSVLRAARNYSVSSALPSRVYLDAEEVPLFTKLAQQVSADALDTYVEQLEHEVDKYLAGGRKESSVVTQVTNGKNAMPAFGGRLSDEEIGDVAAYVIDQANGDKWDD